MNSLNCFIKNEFHASGGHVGFESIPIELWVHDSEQAERAVSILEKELTANKDLPDWECAKCGEENDASFESCWKCQAAAAEI